MSEIKQALEAARDIVDVCAGDNRPATGWAAKVRTQIDAALSSAAVAEQEPVAKAVELSGNTGELIEKMAEAIRGDTTSDDTPWATLSEDRKIGWRGDAERALAVVKKYLTALRPTEQAVTEAMVETEMVRMTVSETIRAMGANPDEQIIGELTVFDAVAVKVRAALTAAQEAGGRG